MDARQSLEPGDIVRLNSDAVRMTVRRVDGDKIVCRWHDDELDLLEEDFARSELVFVKSGKA
jgi:uncharacterized protein YodC (DUF2158 family)